MSKSLLCAPALLAVLAGCGAPSTPDAGTECASQMFTKYGAAGFTAVNNAILTKALAAPTSSLGASFQNLTMAQRTTLGTNLAAFLIQAYGGPQNYAGKTMKAAHTGLAITEAQYDYFVTNAVVPALTESGVSMADVTNCFAPAVTTKAAGSVKCDTIEMTPRPTGCP
jgi:truncated hemoglobin YjbI